MAPIMFIGFFILMIIGTPIAIALGLSAVIAMAGTGGMNLIALPQRMFAAVDSFPLMAAPFFILAGKLMEHGGISRRLIDFANSLVGSLRGGLAHVSLMACMIFAAISGSASATTAAVGSILIPSMVQKGYDRAFSTAVQAAGGTVGVIIPPSVPLVIYGVTAGVSVTNLFIAGIIPGLFIVFSLMVVAYIISYRRGYGGNDERKNAGEILRNFANALSALLMPVIILGGIYGGIFTPTEASVVAVVYGLFVGTFIYREIKLGQLREILTSSVITTSVLLFLVATAAMFGNILTREQVPQVVANFMVGISDNWIVILLLINILLLVVGTFLETIAAIIILTPILHPIAIHMGMDPVHFGIIMIVNLSIGLITPPVGMCLFIGANVGQVKYEPLVRAVIPFLLMMIVNVLIISLYSPLSLFLVKLLS